MSTLYNDITVWDVNTRAGAVSACISILGLVRRRKPRKKCYLNLYRNRCENETDLAIKDVSGNHETSRSGLVNKERRNETRNFVQNEL
jgi:hypothetical protein